MKKSKIKKSQVILVGSFLILVGIIILSFGHLQVLKEQVYESVRLSLFSNLDSNSDKSNIITDTSDVSNISSAENNSVTTPNNNASSFKYNYIGYLEIPKISLKRGFLNKDSKYNDINYNVTVSQDASFPDVQNGNLILIAHSGDAYISFFAYLYKLKIGDVSYITYGGKKYKYQLVKIEEQPKTGLIAIHRPNYNVNGLTLITCTKDNDSTQSIYIFELV